MKENENIKLQDSWFLVYFFFSFNMGLNSELDAKNKNLPYDFRQRERRMIKAATPPTTPTMMAIVFPTLLSSSDDPTIRIKFQTLMIIVK